MTETATNQDYSARVTVEGLDASISLSVDLTDRLREEALEEISEAVAEVASLLDAAITTQDQALALTSAIKHASAYAEVAYMLMVGPEDMS